MQKLEEALHRVESFIHTREGELKNQQERLQETHWHEVEQLEKKVSRDEAQLKDAHRRKIEIQAKIEDAQKRLTHL